MNVLISSAGRRLSLLRSFRSALSELGLNGKVFASDASPLSAAAFDSDGYVPVPKCSEPSYIPTLFKACQDLEISVIVPTIDYELHILSVQRERFTRSGTSIFISSPATVDITTDKEATASWLEMNGFPAVPTRRLVGGTTIPKEWSPPFVVKPRRGSASRGMVLVEDRSDRRLLSDAGDFIIQPFQRGPEFSIDVWISRSGVVECAVPRLRMEVRSGEVSKAVTSRDDRLEGLAVDIAEALPGAYGALTIQVIGEGEGVRVIEINPRFGGGYPLSHAAGADFAKWGLEELSGSPSTASRSAWRDRLVMLRYDEGVFLDASSIGL